MSVQDIILNKDPPKRNKVFIIQSVMDLEYKDVLLKALEQGSQNV